MKNLIVGTLMLIPTFGHAKIFNGTMVLKGSVKSKIALNGVETTCRVEIEKVRNILDEDSYGNPGYRVRANVKLDGQDEKRKIVIKHEQKANLTNFHKVGDKVEARDLEYADVDTGITMAVNDDGRLEKVSLKHEGKNISCLF
jgi:hypothetical protein